MAARKTTTKKATTAKEVATEIKNAAVEGTAKVAEVVDETKKTVEKKASAAKKTVKKVVKKETVVTATDPYLFPISPPRLQMLTRHLTRALRSRL